MKLLVSVLTLQLLSNCWNASAAEPRREGKWCVGYGCTEDNLHELFSQSWDDAVEARRRLLQTEDDRATISTSNIGETKNDVENAEPSCSAMTLEMTTPQDISFKLVCDGAPVWTYPAEGWVRPKDVSLGVFNLAACVAPTACCEFTIQDESGPDGNVSGETGESHLSLDRDGKGVFQYQIKKSLPFESYTKVFGDSCKAKKQEEKDQNEQAGADDTVEPIECNKDEETPVHFAITLDEHPEQQSWYLICDKGDRGLETLLDVPRGSLTTADANANMEEEACVSTNSKCVFSIVDSQGDGMTTGGYSLTFGNQMIGNYDSSSKEPFVENHYCVGHTCEELPEESGASTKSDYQGPNPSGLPENVESSEPALKENDIEESAFSQENDSEVRSLLLIVFVVAVTIGWSVYFILFCLRRSKTASDDSDGQDKDDNDDARTVDTDEEFIL